MAFYIVAIQVFSILMNVFLTSNGEKDDIANCEICAADSTEKKVMNGTEVATGKYPWIVALKGRNGVNFCTGSIISSKYILTATHCFIRGDMKASEACRSSRMPLFCFSTEVNVLIGLRDLKLMEVKRIILHPEYAGDTFHNDIALVEMKGAIQCDRVSKPLCLPERDLSQVGQDLLVAGYGYNKLFVLSNEKLTEGAVKQVPQRECDNTEFDNEMHLCAKGEKTNQGSCIGDSGSTIFKKEYKTFYGVGITSNGPPICLSGGPGVTYTNIYKYMGWIKQYEKNLAKPRKDMGLFSDTHQINPDDPSTSETLYPVPGIIGYPRPIPGIVGASNQVPNTLGVPNPLTPRVDPHSGTFEAPLHVPSNRGVNHDTFGGPPSLPGALGVQRPNPGLHGVPYSETLGASRPDPGLRGTPLPAPRTNAAPNPDPVLRETPLPAPRTNAAPNPDPGIRGTPLPDPRTLEATHPEILGASHPGHNTFVIIQPVFNIKKCSDFDDGKVTSKG